MYVPQAIIFDLDGVLTDTSEYHYQAWKHLANDEGIAFTHEENDAHLRGIGRRESLGYLIRGRKYSDAQIQEMMERENRYYSAFVAKMTPGEFVAGGRTLLQEIHQMGLKAAIASASKNCRDVLERMEVLALFDGVADGYSVVNGKPAADIFVYAAGLVGVPTTACLGIEDAAAGVAAIKTAGMLALGIGPRERFQDPDAVLPSLANVHLTQLLAELK
jgi:beta-phosphoglucomutase